MTTNLVLMFLCMVILLLLKVPIAFSVGLGSILFLYLSDIDLIMVGQRMFAATDSFILTAIPFFILAGLLMAQGGVTRRIINFGYAIMGHIRGCLAMVNVVASMIFAGVSGSSLADTSGIGAVLIPAMKEKGYDADFSAGITATSSTIGNIIPPSINALIYASVASVSVGKLFLGGAIPGILVGLGQMGLAYLISVRKGYPTEKRPTLRAFVVSLKDAALALIMPLIIIGGIVGGIVTPTEAGVLAIVYGFVISMFVYRELRLKHLLPLLIGTTSVTASVLMIIVAANIFAWVVAFIRIPELVAAWMLRISENPYVVLIMINLILLAVGTVIVPGAAIIIFTPIFLPLAQEIGLDPVHFGVIIMMNVIIGVVTPPVGPCLYAASKIAGVPATRVFRAVLPFLLANLTVLFLATFCRPVVMFLPDLFK